MIWRVAVVSLLGFLFFSFLFYVSVWKIWKRFPGELPTELGTPSATHFSIGVKFHLENSHARLIIFTLEFIEPFISQIGRLYPRNYRQRLAKIPTWSAIKCRLMTIIMLSRLFGWIETVNYGHNRVKSQSWSVTNAPRRYWDSTPKEMGWMKPSLNYRLISQPASIDRLIVNSLRYTRGLRSALA